MLLILELIVTLLVFLFGIGLLVTLFLIILYLRDIIATK